MKTARKTRIYHIHTDEKFVEGTKKFDSDMFENTVIFIGKRKSFEMNMLHYSSSKASINEILKICNDKAEIVVMHGLDLGKAYICNRLNGNVLVLWRFFGSELYVRNKMDFYSTKTKLILSKNSRGLLSVLTKGMNKLRLMMKWGLQYKKELGNARPHFILCTSEEEHRFLIHNYKSIPELIILPFSPISNKLPPKECKENHIIVGNSRSPFNNHADIIEIISHADFRKKYKYIFPLSYGKDLSYSTSILSSFPKDLDIISLNDFVPKTDYYHMFQRAKMLVINSYRQHAVGNILMAISMGAIVYLNDRNPIYHFLIRNQIQVFSITDFQKHLATECIPDIQTILENNYKKLALITSLDAQYRFQVTISEKYVMFRKGH